MTFFKKYNPFKAQTTPLKTKNTCFSLKKKSLHTSHPKHILSIIPNSTVVIDKIRSEVTVRS